MKAENNTRTPLVVYDDDTLDALYITTDARLANSKAAIAEISIGYDEPFESEQRQYADDLVHRYNSHDALVAALEELLAAEQIDYHAPGVLDRARAALSQSRGEKP